MIQTMNIQFHISGEQLELFMIKIKVSEADLEKEGYNIFLDAKYKEIFIYMILNVIHS